MSHGMTATAYVESGAMNSGGYHAPTGRDDELATPAGVVATARRWFGLSPARAAAEDRPRSVGYLPAVIMTTLDDRHVYERDRPGIMYEEWRHVILLTIGVRHVEPDRIRMTTRGNRVTLAIDARCREAIDTDAASLQPGRELSFDLPSACRTDALRVSLAGDRLTLIAPKTPLRGGPHLRWKRDALRRTVV
jgi:hypothetical protein